jgi:hypothetical protein
VKKLILVAMVIAVLASLVGASVVMAKAPNGPAGKSDTGHINLVAKDTVGPDGIPDTGDETWATLSYEGKLKYQVSDGMVCVVLNASGLVPGNWYYAQLIDKQGGGYVPVNENGDGVAGDNDCYAMFYDQANGGGNIHISFCTSMDIVSGQELEINVKNAEWAALLNPSTPGTVAEWAGPTAQGWDAVLFSEATIPMP